MYRYVPEYVQVGNATTTTIALITARNPFDFISPDVPEVLKKIYAAMNASNKTTHSATRVLGLYTDRAEAEAAYDAWCEEIEGTGVWGEDPDPWDGLSLQILPCEVKNVPDLVDAAQTGQKVYVSRSSAQSPEKVMTEAHFKAIVNALNASSTRQFTDLRTGHTRGPTRHESEDFDRRLLSSLQRGSEEISQTLLAVLRAQASAVKTPTSVT